MSNFVQMASNLDTMNFRANDLPGPDRLKGRLYIMSDRRLIFKSTLKAFSLIHTLFELVW